jgi:hypothetical protein
MMELSTIEISEKDGSGSSREGEDSGARAGVGSDLRLGRQREKGDSLGDLVVQRMIPGVEFADTGEDDLRALGLFGIVIEGVLWRGEPSLLGGGGEAGLMGEGEGSAREAEPGSSRTIVSLSLLRKLLLLLVGLGD